MADALNVATQAASFVFFFTKFSKSFIGAPLCFCDFAMVVVSVTTGSYEICTLL